MILLRQICASLFVFGIMFSCSTVRANDDEKTIFCVFNAQARERKFTLDDINPNLCTHIVAMDLSSSGFGLINSSLHREFVTKMKSKNPEVKVLIYLSPELENLSTIGDEEITNTTHIEIAENIAHILHERNVDGVLMRSPPAYKASLNFNDLMEAMKVQFQPHGYLLGVYGNSDFYGMVPEEYDIPVLRNAVDFLLLKTYNYLLHPKDDEWADHHAPLYPRSWHKKNHTNVDFQVRKWISDGFPANKIIINIPLYGKSWTLTSDKTNPPAPAKDRAPPQNLISSDELAGSMGYVEICMAIANRNWSVVQDVSQSVGPYALSPADYGENNRTWVGYDDPDMAVIKSNYVISKGLRGVYLGEDYFDISYDDYRNFCIEGPYPILTAVRKTLTPGWVESSTYTLIPSLFLFFISLLLSTSFQVV